MGDYNHSLPQMPNSSATLRGVGQKAQPDFCLAESSFYAK